MNCPFGSLNSVDTTHASQTELTDLEYAGRPVKNASRFVNAMQIVVL